MSDEALAQARRLYLHCQSGGAITAADMSRLIGSMERDQAEVAARVAEAVAQEREANARVADRIAAQAHTALQEPGIIDAIRRDYLHQRNGARDVAAAIRARGGSDG